MGRFFGTNGVRIRFEGGYDIGFVVKFTEAIATYLGSGDVLVGFDARTTSMPLVGLIYGTLTLHGIGVDVIGPIPTPIHQYLVKAWRYKGGIMVTASHNPPQYNGIKVMGSDGVEVDRPIEDEIESIYVNGRFKAPSSFDKVGRLSILNVEDGLREYREHLLSLIDTKPIEARGFRIVADFANSVTSIALPYVLRGLNVKVLSLNGHIDGLFPGRLPEPRPDTLREASSLVPEAGADLGVAFDGDGDRSMFIDERGEVIWGDRTGAILALSMLKRGDKVVTPVSSSIVVKWSVEGAGGQVVWTRVGSVDVSHTVVRLNALCGFEDNGGFIWPKHHPVRDGIATTLLMLQTLATEGATLSSLNAKMPKMYSARDRVEVDRSVARLVTEELAKLDWGGEKVTIDGVRVNYADSWFLVRPSGTEDLLRIIVEASSEASFNELRGRVMGKVNELVKKYAAKPYT